MRYTDFVGAIYLLSQMLWWRAIIMKFKIEIVGTGAPDCPEILNLAEHFREPRRLPYNEVNIKNKTPTVGGGAPTPRKSRLI